MDLPGDATVEWSLRQGMKVGQLSSPGLSNAHALSMDNTHIISHTVLKQTGIEFLKGSDLRNGHEKVAPTEPYTVFYPTFLMSLSWRAKVAGKQVIAAKGNVGALFLSNASFHQKF